MDLPTTLETDISETPETTTAPSPNVLTQLVLDYKKIPPNSSDAHAALAAIWEQVRPIIHQTAFSVLHDRDEAEDAVQDVAVLLLRKMDTFDFRSQFNSWLHRVTVNAALKRILSEKKSLCRADVPLDSIASTNIEDAEEAEARNENQRLLFAVLNNMDPVFTKPIILADLAEIPGPQAAKLMNLGLSAFKSRLHRGRVRLREELQSLMSVV